MDFAAGGFVGFLGCAAPQRCRKRRDDDVNRFLRPLVRPSWRLRRFLLVGVAVFIVPGTLTQLIASLLFMVVYTILQVQARPFRNLTDDYLSLAAS